MQESIHPSLKWRETHDEPYHHTNFSRPSVFCFVSRHLLGRVEIKQDRDAKWKKPLPLNWMCKPSTLNPKKNLEIQMTLKSKPFGQPSDVTEKRCYTIQSCLFPTWNSLFKISYRLGEQLSDRKFVGHALNSGFNPYKKLYFNKMNKTP